MFFRPSALHAATVLTLALLLAAPSALAQSTAPSQASAISVEASEASAAVAIEALPAGSQLVVTALQPVGDMVELSVEVVGQATAVTLKVSAAVVRTGAIAVGDTLAITALSAGVLISAGGETIAFLPDRLACALTHHREL